METKSNSEYDNGSKMGPTLYEALRTYDAFANREVIPEKLLEDFSCSELLEGVISKESQLLTIPFCNALHGNYDKKALIELYIPKSAILEKRIKNRAPLINLVEPDLKKITKELSTKNKDYFFSEEYKRFAKDICHLIRIPHEKGLFMGEALKNYFEIIGAPVIGLIFLAPISWKIHSAVKGNKKFYRESLEPDSAIRNKLNYLDTKLKEEGF